MHGRFILAVVALGLTGCDDPPPVCDDGGEPTSKRATVVPSGMPLEPVALRPWGAAAPHRRQVDDATLMQALILAQRGELPLEPTGPRQRVLAAAPGSLFELAGLRVGDEIVSLAGVAVDDDELSAAAFRAWRRDGRLSLAIVRNGEPLELDYTREGPPVPETDRADRSAADVSGELVVHDRGGGVYELPRSSAERFFTDPSGVTRSARIVPSTKHGSVVGLKVFGIRPDSALAKLGLKNGDTILRLGGFDVSDPEKALEAYEKLRGASEVRVDIERHGAPITLVYRIVP